MDSTGSFNLNVHFHTLVLDGIYDARDGMRFHPLSPPDDDEVERVTRLRDRSRRCPAYRR